MSEFLSDLLIAVITATVPVLTVYGVSLIRKVAANAAAQTDNTKAQGYITEIGIAVSDAVSATSQTYVDALKKAGSFTKEAQTEAAQRALATCIASISPAAAAFIEQAYGDMKDYLMTRIEAQVRAQKALPTSAPAALESVASDATTVAASTAAATAATIAQTAIQQISAEPSIPEQE